MSSTAPGRKVCAPTRQRRPGYPGSHHGRQRGRKADRGGNQAAHGQNEAGRLMDIKPYNPLDKMNLGASVAELKGATAAKRLILPRSSE